jgi:hypothetical protein
MRFSAQGIPLFLVLALAGTPAVRAQGQRDQIARQDLQQKPIQSQALTLSEGLAILGAALDTRHHAGYPTDCSHFVHELYKRAGFPYEYASSSDLYAGTGQFRRVTSPQPGDLAVWPGHAGVVVNPAQHSFFSILRSGPGVDLYDSKYWKGRGRPRFFRYIKTAPSGVPSNSAIQTASWKPSTSLDKTRPQEAPVDDPSPDGAEHSSSQTGASAKLAVNQPVDIAPLVAVVSSLRPKPDQVSAAFLQACNASGEQLRGHDLLRSTQSLVVFDHFHVKRVHVTGNQGWVEVEIKQLVSLGEQAKTHKRTERQRWPIVRRDSKSWELTPSSKTIYLPPQIAERLLAHELAQLTEDSSNPASRAQDKATLARVLQTLLDK